MGLQRPDPAPSSKLEHLVSIRKKGGQKGREGKREKKQQREAIPAPSPLTTSLLFAGRETGISNSCGRTTVARLRSPSKGFAQGGRAPCSPNLNLLRFQPSPNLVGDHVRQPGGSFHLALGMALGAAYRFGVGVVQSTAAA